MNPSSNMLSDRLKTCSRELLESVIDQLPIGVILLDAEGRVLRFNRHEEHLSGLRRDAVLGKSFFSDIAPCTEQVEFERLFREGIESRDLSLDFEFNFPHRYNRVPRDVRIRAESIRAEKNPMDAVHAVLIEDITSRAQLERHNVDMLDGLRSVIAKSRGVKVDGPAQAKAIRVAALAARISGFDEFASKHPPAELFGQVDARLRTVTEYVSQAGGTIDALTGDGVVAWFELGDGQARRGWFEAVRVARRISRIVGEPGLDLSFSVGVAVGDVVHGPVGRPEFGNRATVGRPISFARALAHVGRPGEVLLDENLLEPLGDTLVTDAVRGVGVPGIPNHGTVYRLQDLNLP